MSAPTGQWNPITESPEQAKAKLRKEEEFAERWKTADFWAWAESMSDALGGIGKIDPETGLQLAEEARIAESKDWEVDNPDLILAKLDDTPDTWNDKWVQAIEYREIMKNTEVTEMIEYPYIQRLVENNTLSPELWAKILKWLLSGNTLKDTIRVQREIWNDLKQAIVDNWQGLNSKKWMQKFAKDFEKDFWEKFTERKDKSFPSELMQSAYESVASAYMIWETSDSESQKKALDMAFATAANTEIFGRQFPRTELFEQTMKKIKNSELSPDERLNSLTKLIALVSTDQWSKWKMIRDARARILWSEEEKSLVLSEQYQEIQEQLRVAEKTWDTSQIAQLEKQLWEITEGSWDITDTSIWDFDTTLEVGGSESPTSMST